MTDAEQREAARQFANKWKGRGREDEDGRSYWIDFLSNVLGMENVTDRVEFEKKVVVDLCLDIIFMRSCREDLFSLQL